jgi:hypothetical protein
MRIFKSEVKEMKHDDEPDKPTPTADTREIEGTIHRADPPAAPRQPVPEAERRDS